MSEVRGTAVRGAAEARGRLPHPSEMSSGSQTGLAGDLRAAFELWAERDAIKIWESDGSGFDK